MSVRGSSRFACFLVMFNDSSLKILNQIHFPMKLKVIFHYTPCLAGGLLPTKYRKQGKLKLPFIFIVDKLMRRLSTQDQNFKQVFADLLAFETVSDPELFKNRRSNHR